MNVDIHCVYIHSLLMNVESRNGMLFKNEGIIWFLTRNGSLRMWTIRVCKLGAEPGVNTSVFRDQIGRKNYAPTVPNQSCNFVLFFFDTNFEIYAEKLRNTEVIQEVRI